MMLPEDMRLWVGRDHLVWFVIDVIEGLDITALESLGRPGKGRPGYDPRMLAALLVYSYLQAERSSRRIEERCRTDAAFRVATGNRFPDHSTLCRFRAAAAQAGGPLEDLFFRVLSVLAAAGLGRLDVVSHDGTKIRADASKEANRTEEGLRKLARRILDEAARADGEDCGCDGHGHGEAAGRPAPGSCGCCDGGMLPGLGLDGPAVPRAGWGGAPRAQRIAAGLADLEAARLGVCQILCARGLFPVRFRMFIRSLFFALSDAVVPGLRPALSESDLPSCSGADAACPGYRGVLLIPGAAA
jgi:transposase